jgi:hypothetical protein
MADLIAEIEGLLRTPHTLKAAPAVREQLNERFGRLTPEAAAELLERLLRPERSQVPYYFRTFSRHVRLQLVLRLARKLKAPVRKTFLTRLVGSTAEHALVKGLYLMFPNGTEAQRQRFTRALEGSDADTRFPSVTLTLRTEGPFSKGNQCSVIVTRDSRVPPKLGVSVEKYSAWMEIVGTVYNHRPEAIYKFSRTKETFLMKYIENVWRASDYDIPGSPDNEDRVHGGEGTDEDDIPENGHIYVVDGPSLHPPDNAPGTEWVKFLNFTERLDLKVKYDHHVVPGVPRYLDWCACLWVEKRAGSWQLNKRKSGIRSGRIDIARVLGEFAQYEKAVRARDAFKIPVDPNGMF